MYTCKVCQTSLPTSAPTSAELKPCCEDQLKRALRPRCLKPEQLRAMGYPRPLESTSDKAFFFVDSISTKSKRCSQDYEGNIYSCDRCEKYFDAYVAYNTNVDLPQNCVYHVRRPEGPFGRRRHSCCNAPAGLKGCTKFQYHVHRNSKPGYNGPLEGYVRATEPRGGIYALDAEMIYTTAGMELARIVVINACGTPVYETLVKPSSRILDCNTVFSGITPKDMLHASKTLQDVQRDILKFVGNDTILIGHALENDLRSLKLVHEVIIDTCALYPHDRGFPFRRALRFLVWDLLGRKIQQGQKGHAPAEDARAALELALLKVKTC